MEDKSEEEEVVFLADVEGEEYPKYNISMPLKDKPVIIQINSNK